MMFCDSSDSVSFLSAQLEFCALENQNALLETYPCDRAALRQSLGEPPNFLVEVSFQVNHPPIITHERQVPVLVHIDSKQTSLFSEGHKVKDK